MNFKRGDKVRCIARFTHADVKQGTIVSIHIRYNHPSYNVKWDQCKSWRGRGHGWSNLDLELVVDPNQILKNML